MAGGRSTEYTKDVAKKAKKYANGGWEVAGDAVPSIVGLCDYIGRSRATIYKWRDDIGGEFSDILDEINQKQHRVALNQGLKNEHNAAITSLLLGKHGYHKKVDTEVSGKDGGAIETNTKWTVEVVKSET